ncbi:MAG: DUF6751 family protein [Bacilli bacterium]
MNMKFFKDQITVYHTENDEVFEIQPFKQVYFRHNKKVNQIDKGIQGASTGTVIIPAVDEINIATDDYVVKGLVQDEFDLSKLQEKYEVLKVLSVDDNRKGRATAL